MKQLRTALIASLTTFLAGCASGPPLVDPSKAPDSKQGVLLTSLTATDGKHTNDNWLCYRTLGSAEKKCLQAVGNAWMPIKPNDFRDQPGRKGRLLAVPLNPGDYELITWGLYIQTFGGYGYINPRVPPPPIQFSIQAGRITYIGNVHVETLTGKNVFGFEIPAGGLATFADRVASDKRLLENKYPQLAAWPMTSTVPATDIWVPRLDSSGEPDATKTLGPLIPAVR